MTDKKDSAQPVAPGQALDTDNEAIGGAQDTNHITTDQPVTQLIPDLDQARRHLLLLDEGEENFVFQTFDDRKDRKDRSLVKILSGTFDQHAPQLTALNRRGAGVYVTVNHSRNGGRKKDDIDGCRAIFREADAPNLPELPLEPHLIIETSPGKHHEYLVSTQA